ncbi:hypothetical protein ROLI_009280 [Roseobacter fucihabitans]|uniref:YjiS-like domain-containing protein n=1 Tax=Roseobacter fucihabitans TaxID=1537242 RepID=A0ABZ2BPC1_9RHOB|nr:hypothetical protein [Roseobacter litoralis]MBC6966677.1 hypothetical protein [Roseobacter litoralis]
MALIEQFFQSSRRTSATRPLRLTTFLSLWRSRRALARLDARALEDIAVTDIAADVEAKRAFWDVPQSWRDQ